SGQYMPHRSQPLHFSGATTCGGWYPLELKAEESASTLVGQNSTQKPQALQRSTTMETRPFATGPPRWKCWALPKDWTIMSCTCRTGVRRGSPVHVMLHKGKRPWKLGPSSVFTHVLSFRAPRGICQ